MPWPTPWDCPFPALLRQLVFVVIWGTPLSSSVDLGACTCEVVLACKWGVAQVRVSGLPGLLWYKQQ